jgi:hypothetical protein
MAYEDFWMALARTCSIGPRCWHMGATWAEEKLEDADQSLLAYFSSEKVDKIAQMSSKSSATCLPYKR